MKQNERTWLDIQALAWKTSVVPSVCSAGAVSPAAWLCLLLMLGLLGIGSAWGLGAAWVELGILVSSQLVAGVFHLQEELQVPLASAALEIKVYFCTKVFKGRSKGMKV